MLLIPFIGIVPFASFATQANHGLEYFYICRKIISKDTHKKKIWIAAVLVILLWAILVIPRYHNLNDSVDAELLTLWLSLLIGFDLLHYWLDRLIYRMRDSETRLLIGPLIN